MFRPCRVLSLAALAAMVSFNLRAVAPTDFKMKLPIAVNAAAVGEKSATDLPVLVRLSESIDGFKYSDLASDGSDLAFGVDDGGVITVYPHEIDTWDPEGESLVWVKVPVLDKDTAFNAYYGNDVNVPLTATSVWGDYKGVWHMNEASGNALDATGNGLDAVPTKNSSYKGDPLEDMIGAEGVFGLARINATDAAQKRTYLSVPAYHMTDASKFTISGWFRMTDPKTGYARIFSSKKTYSDKYGFEIECAQGSAVKLSPRGASQTAPSVTIPSLVDNWVHLLFVYDSTTVYVYANGALAGSGAVSAPNEQYKLSIGSNTDGTEWSLYGKYDEVRLMDGVVSADRVSLEYSAMAGGLIDCGKARALDAAAPKFEVPSLLGASTEPQFSVRVLSGKGTIGAKYTQVFSGAETTDVIAEGVDVAEGAPQSFADSPTLEADTMYAFAAVGTSPTGTPVIKNGSEYFYNGEIAVAAGEDAQEAVLAPGTFVISRADTAAAKAGDLIVRYVVSGGEGTFEELSGEAVIPDGEVSVTVSLVPVYTTEVDEDVEVSLTLAGGAYGIGSSASAKIKVVNSSENIYTRYVAEDGDDEKSGMSVTSPMATLQAAVDSLAAVSADNDCTIYVAEGTYPQPINVEKEYCVYITGRISIVGMTGDPKDVVITRNDSAYAIFNVDNANAKLQYLTITNGRLWGSNSGGVQKGGGVYLANGVVEDCVVSDCTGPAYGQAGVGIYVLAGRVSRCEVRNCTSSNDEANGTGICLDGGLVEDTLVTGCSCKNGGAIKLSGAAKAVNCTVVKNTGMSVAGIRIDSDTAKAVNCAIFGNTVTESMTRGVYTETRGSCYVNCAADLEIVGGVGCLHCQPVYRDWVNGDFRPIAGSPLLNAGASRADYGATGETDLAGASRVVGSVDIGCYENQADAAEVGLWWGADRRTLPTTVTFSAGASGVDSPTYEWTLRNETTGDEKTAQGQTLALDFAEGDAGTYTVSVTAGGLIYTSNDKLQLSPAALYVDAASPAPAFPFGAEAPAATVQAAIDAAADGATVFVAAGTYPINAQLTVSKALRILGTGRKYTDVVITNTVKSSNRRIFVLQHENAFVAHLTMAGGYTSGGGSGGDLYISGNGGTVSNCLLTAGSTDASYQQGAAAAYLNGGLLTHCEITRCNAMPKSGQPCPRILYVAGTARASNCLIHDCDYRIDYVYRTENGTRGGGSLINVAANGILDGCTIADVVNADNSSIVYVSSAQGGFAKSAKVVNCAIFGSDQNGAALNPMQGGNAYNVPPTVCFKNCVTERSIEVTYETKSQNLLGTYTADESNVMDATRSACFADYENGDYRVKDATSPLFNAAETTIAEVPQLSQVDFAGNPRVAKKGMDVGCYELKAAGFMIFVR